jgi:hypothetical protein
MGSQFTLQSVFVLSFYNSIFLLEFLAIQKTHSFIPFNISAVDYQIGRFRLAIYQIKNNLNHIILIGWSIFVNMGGFRAPSVRFSLPGLGHNNPI